MRVEALRAEALPDGQVALRWQSPAGHEVRVLRAERDYPAARDRAAEIHRVAAQLKPAADGFVDGPLQGETVYYYTVATTDGAGQTEVAQVSVLAMAPHGTETQLYNALPDIYRLLDRTGGRNEPVRRLLEIFARPLDELRSSIASMRDLHDVNRVDGALLPLLAQWIGQPPDTTLGLERQRNIVRYAPQYFRTAGVPANLRAAINRYVTWDVRLREMVHSVALTNHPEWLTLWEMRSGSTGWLPPKNVNLDVAYEGRAAALSTTDGRDWLIYHARRPGPTATGRLAGQDGWHLYARIGDGEAQPALRLSWGDELFKHPTAVERSGHAVWVFHTSVISTDTRSRSRIGLKVLSVGRAAQPAERIGTRAGPFALTDGMALTVRLGPTGIERTIIVRDENLPMAAPVPAESLARLIDRELPGIDVTATPDGRIALRTRDTGSGATFNLDGTSPLAIVLGLADGPVAGRDAEAASLLSERAAPFALFDGATLTVRTNGMPPRTVTFKAGRFASIGQASAAEVVASLNGVLGPIARQDGDRVRLTQPDAGPRSLVVVDSDASTAAPALGFGTALPHVDGVDDQQPTAVEDPSGGIRLAWSSRRNGKWQIALSRLSDGAWAPDKPLYYGDAWTGRSNSEPFMLFDPDQRLWVFWTRRRDNGRRNVLWRSTLQLDFDALVEGDWTEGSYAVASTADEVREPAAIPVAGGVELFVASDRLEGWNVWSRIVSAAGQQAESRLTAGPASHRFPTPAVLGDGSRTVLLRSNQSQVYTSKVYPDATTIDAQYSGTTTLNLSNPDKFRMRGRLEDMQRYTMDTRRPTVDEANQQSVGDPAAFKGLFARDVVGVYLKPDTEDQKLVLHQHRLFVDALRRVLPIQVRLAFIAGRSDEEPIYGYGRPDGDQPVIGEQMIDTLLGEVIGQPTDGFEDTLPNVRFLRTWTAGETSGLPNLSPPAPDLSSRIFLKSAREGQ